MSRAAFSSILPLRLSLALTVASATSCGPRPFASIEMLVREPAAQSRPGASRRLNERENLFIGVDHPDPVPSQSFEPGVAPLSVPIELGDVEHNMELGLTTGTLERPTAVAHGDDITIPSLSSLPADQSSIHFVVPVLLAKPNVPEALDKGVPSARTGTAACNQKDGRGWVVGGSDNGYTFKRETLLATEAFRFQAGGLLACDGDDHGKLLVYEPSAHSLILDASADSPTVVDVGGTAATVAYVRVVPAADGSAVAWVGGADRIAVVDGNGGVQAKNVSAADAHYAAVNDTTLARFFVGGGGELYVVGANGIEGPSVLVSPDVVAVDPNSASFLANSSGLLQLEDVETSSGQPASLRILRFVDFGNLHPDEMLILADGRVAGLQHLTGGGALVAIEGNDAVPVNREHMVLTVGGALILFGGADGHDVFVVP